MALTSPTIAASIDPTTLVPNETFDAAVAYLRDTIGKLDAARVRYKESDLRYYLDTYLKQQSISIGREEAKTLFAAVIVEATKGLGTVDERLRDVLLGTGYTYSPLVDALTGAPSTVPEEPVVGGLGREIYKAFRAAVERLRFPKYPEWPPKPPEAMVASDKLLEKDRKGMREADFQEHDRRKKEIDAERLNFSKTLLDAMYKRMRSSQLLQNASEWVVAKNQVLTVQLAVQGAVEHLLQLFIRSETPAALAAARKSAVGPRGGTGKAREKTKVVFTVAEQGQIDAVCVQMGGVIPNILASGRSTSAEQSLPWVMEMSAETFSAAVLTGITTTLEQRAKAIVSPGYTAQAHAKMRRVNKERSVTKKASEVNEQP